MSVQIEIPDVPDEVHDELATRAAIAKQPMAEYLRGELERLASRPSVDQWLKTVRERKSSTPRAISAAVILAHRDADRR